jgi:hypothetical protein
LVVAVISSHVSAQGADSRQRLVALVPQIQKNLRENVVPFWFPRSIDKQNGGYTVHYGPKGDELAGGTKMIVTQARQLWLSSRLIRAKFAEPSLREAADNGFRFLRDRMWDQQHGGFYWEVDPAGKEVRRPHKHLYGQAFGLYALSEYALATGNRQALELANTLFDLLEAKAWDRDYGGYREFFARDWSSAPAGVQPYLTGSPSSSRSRRKLSSARAGSPAPIGISATGRRFSITRPRASPTATTSRTSGWSPMRCTPSAGARRRITTCFAICSRTR